MRKINTPTDLSHGDRILVDFNDGLGGLKATYLTCENGMLRLSYDDFEGHNHLKMTVEDITIYLID